MRRLDVKKLKQEARRRVEKQVRSGSNREVVPADLTAEAVQR